MIGKASPIRVVQVSRHRGGRVQRAKDSLSVEEPLEIRSLGEMWRQGRSKRLQSL
ncbi:MAG: hypothetical protein CM1200mP14_20630 [Gammaproteobacteria bacterium]|nr:MAG: hypothetical protein CM1200mP14_20630 [Gammaproteobacteria bacterium]